MSQFRRKIGRKLVVCTQVLWCALLSYQSDCLVCQNETKKHGHLKLEINFYLVCLVLTERFCILEMIQESLRNTKQKRQRKTFVCVSVFVKE